MYFRQRSCSALKPFFKIKFFLAIKLSTVSINFLLEENLCPFKLFLSLRNSSHTEPSQMNTEVHFVYCNIRIFKILVQIILFSCYTRTQKRRILKKILDPKIRLFRFHWLLFYLTVVSANFIPKLRIPSIYFSCIRRLRHFFFKISKKNVATK